MKLSSPNLNYLIIAGAALLYMSVFLYIFSATNKDDSLTQTLLCNVSLMVINMIVKTGLPFCLLVSAVDVISGLHSVLCSHPDKGLEGLLHIF